MTFLRRFAESLLCHFEWKKRRNARWFATSVVCYPNLYIIVGVIVEWQSWIANPLCSHCDPSVTAATGILSVISVRPKVAELAFHVFSRSLHPELYTVHRTRRIERDAYHAQIDITNCGHVITWNTTGKTPVTLCEVATSAHQPLPAKRCLISKSLKGSRTEKAVCHCGVEYRTHFQLEPVAPDMFFMVQQQLSKQSTEGLLHTFDSSGRMSMGALSYVNIETRQRSMLVQAIHTFPDDYAIVKVESLFSLPE